MTQLSFGHASKMGHLQVMSMGMGIGVCGGRGGVVGVGMVMCGDRVGEERRQG
jgi:hypothetical protein